MQLENSHKDRFDIILPPFIYSNEETATSIFPQLDRAYEKGSKVITKHSIMIKGVEHNKWIDDTYLLIGMSHFYKADYLKALEAFDYIVKQFKDSPIKYQAMLWMARTYIQMENYERAQFTLDYIKENGLKKLTKKNKLSLHKTNENKRVKRNFYAVYADWYIRQGNYQPAIQLMENAISLAKKKKQKRRYVYILGQLNQKLDKLAFANHKYKWVLKMNPPYDMAFNAKMNIAQCFNPNDANESKKVKKLFLKMTKDVKNKEYLDQIYYALAQIAFKESDSTNGIDYLKLSIENSKENKAQKATSCLQLAEIYFNKRSYEDAQTYYDSTMIFLPTDHPDYEKIANKHSVLSDLVINLKTVYTEDSIQKIAKMDESQRNKVISKIIENIIIEENRKKQEELAQQQKKLQALANQQSLNSQNAGQWYFYNTNAVGAGYNEFVAKWGERKLEDNWRISNKGLTTDFSDNNETDTAQTNTLSDKKNPEIYISKLPLTEEKIEISNQKIINALYALGTIYKEGLEDNKKSIASYEELIDRFPENKYKLNVYYLLYRLYKEEKNVRKSDYYKNIILDKYPDTDYANIIRNPDYDASKNSVDKTILNIYDETYSNYKNGNFDNVIDNSKNIISKYPNSKYISHFKYLLFASQFAKNKDTVSLKAELNQLINLPITDNNIRKASNELLTLLENKAEITKYEKQNKKENEDTITGRIYFISDKSIHFAIMVFNAIDINVENVKNSLSDFNSTYFSLDNLSISNIFLDDKRQMFTVINFNNKESALKYFNALKQKWDFLQNIETNDYHIFVISSDNYKTFYKRKNIEEHFFFFEKNYLK